MGAREFLRGWFGRSDGSKGEEGATGVERAPAPEGSLTASCQLADAAAPGSIGSREDPVPPAISEATEPVPAELPVERGVRESVEKVLNPDDEQKIRYFFIRLLRDVYGIVPIVERPYGSFVRVTIPGKFRHDEGILKVLVAEVSSDAGKKRESKVVSPSAVVFGNLKVDIGSFYSKGTYLDVSTVSGKLRDSDLENLRDFLENSFLREYSVNESSGLDASDVRGILELPENALVIMESKFLEISIPLEGELVPSDALFEKIAILLNAKFDKFDTKHRYSPLVGSVFSIRDFARGLEYESSFEWKDSMLSVRIGAPRISMQEFQLTKDLLSGPMKFLAYELSHSDKRKTGALDALRDMGVTVEEKDPEAEPKTLEVLYSEEGFVGYEDIKDVLASNIIYPWERREKYREEASKEFPRIKGVIPNAALFEGPPGTGKTTFAKIIGRYLGCPFVYVPIGKIMSKWYGESEGRLDRIFELARKAAEENGGIVVMIDEIDEIGKNRDDSHEATGRITGVLLKKLDGMEKISNLLLIGSTNRKDSMDPALLSRFSRQVYFRNPDAKEIPGILSYYLPQAAGMDSLLFDRLEGKSGREIKNFAEDVARKHLRSKIVENDESDVRKALSESLAALHAPVAQ